MKPHPRNAETLAKLRPGDPIVCRRPGDIIRGTFLRMQTPSTVEVCDHQSGAVCFLHVGARALSSSIGPVRPWLIRRGRRKASKRRKAATR
jgi:hypothetical protein